MNQIKHAIIVAAGLGNRLHPHTKDLPKPLVSVAGKSLLARSIENLIAVGVERFTIVVGHMREKIVSQFSGKNVEFVVNPFYKSTNNMASLWFALQKQIPDGFFYLHSDLLYDSKLLALAANHDDDIVLVTEECAWDEEAMKVEINKGYLVSSNKGLPPEKTFGEWTGLVKFTRKGGEQFKLAAEKLIEAGHEKAYDTMAFSELASKKFPIKIADFKNIPWIEIDNDADLKRAQAIVLPALSAMVP